MNSISQEPGFIFACMVMFVHFFESFSAGLFRWGLNSILSHGACLNSFLGWGEYLGENEWCENTIKKRVISLFFVCFVIRFSKRRLCF